MRVRRGEIASVFLRVGNLTFGGGDPAMAALQRELVERRGWLTQDEYTLVWSLARVTPGTNILAFCAGSGWLLAGATGAVLAVVAGCLPAALLSYWLTVAERQWQSNPWLIAALRGIGATVAGMMLAGALLLLKPAWREPGGRMRAVLFAAAGATGSYAGASPLVVLAAAAAAGWMLASPAAAAAAEDPASPR